MHTAAALIVLRIGLLAAGGPAAATAAKEVLPKDWQEKVLTITWVAYSPPSGNPNRRIEATPEALRQDLEVLRKAKFTGLVTYGSAGVVGKELPRIAQEAGFKGLIMGIWEPGNQAEVAAAVVAASHAVVLGYCVGNEGLPEKGQQKGRYTFEQLAAAIQSLRSLTGKPVTTAEQYDDYAEEQLLRLGDWLFPTVHPYFHRVRDPEGAADWTKTAYDSLSKRSGRFVLFKEVGLPTAGDPEGKMSEEGQEKYYVELAKTNVRFVYFEAFDQPWKTHLPIEPHWGIFRADKTPKLLGTRLLAGASLSRQSRCPDRYCRAGAKGCDFLSGQYAGNPRDLRTAWNPDSVPLPGEEASDKSGPVLAGSTRILPNLTWCPAAPE